MKFQAGLVLFAVFALVSGQVERHEERHKEERHGGRRLGEEEKVERHGGEKVSSRDRVMGGGRKGFEEQVKKGEFKLSEKAKEQLVEEKREHVFFEKEIEFFLKNPNTKMERECFANNFKPGQSVDFVIDIAPSPSLDTVDKLIAESPISLFLQSTVRSASRVYFGAIQLFIDAVTIDMKPEVTHSIIYENGRKFYIRGRGVEDVESIEKLKSKGEFMDVERNLKTLWPVCTKEVVSVLEPIVKNNLGRMTKLALWNRDNGLPIVLSDKRRSKPVYTVVITDGSSGSKIDQLSDDLTRTTIIDIGNRRFANKLSWEEMRRVAGVYTLTSPQQLPLMMDTIRNMACLFGEHSKNM